MNNDSLTLADFPLHSYDKVRYGDTDKQGHVNNAVFSTYLETGRVDFLCHPDNNLLSDKTSFVIASLNLKLLAEIHWPGLVDIGTRVVRVGNSSFGLEQGLFQEGRWVASAETVIVQVDNATSRSAPLSDEAKTHLQSLIAKGATE